jgi:hypothetical protein
MIAQKDILLLQNQLQFLQHQHQWMDVKVINDSINKYGPHSVENIPCRQLDAEECNTAMSFNLM